MGYEDRVTPDASFTQDRRELAEIPARTTTTFFYELQLTDLARGSGTLGRV